MKTSLSLASFHNSGASVEMSSSASEEANLGKTPLELKAGTVGLLLEREGARRPWGWEIHQTF